MFNAKQSEIEAAKHLLQAVTSSSALKPSLPGGFSLDALHAQVDTLTLLESQHRHYLVGLKANQKKLHQQMQRLQQSSPLSQVHHAEILHGRQTQRTVRVYATPPGLPERWVTAGALHN